ncbi:hypothetical protein SPLC1_S207300 [Arthrospira platensis C1]|nr:hypothetical protein SPLC1_S207300 [Arthrospira platensis C1]
MGQSLAPIAYYPPGHYHFPEGSLPIIMRVAIASEVRSPSSPHE